MSRVSKAEQFLFYCLCGFAFTLPISKAVGNLFLSLSLILFFYRIYFKHDDIQKIFFANKNIFAVIGLLFGAVLISAFSSEEFLTGLKSWLNKYFFHASIILPIIFITHNKEKIFSIFKFLLLGSIDGNTKIRRTFGTDARGKLVSHDFADFFIDIFTR